jgi:hypothetical protein
MITANTLRQSVDPEDALAVFLLRHDHTHVDRLSDAIEDACSRGCGFWLKPTPLNATPRSRPATGRALGAENAPLEPFPGAPRPATHLHEITLFGIFAAGPTAEVAARNWRTVARRFAAITGPDFEIGF